MVEPIDRNILMITGGYNPSDTSYVTDLSTAINQIGSANKTLVIDGPIALTGNTTVPSNILLKVSNKEAYITSNGFTLTINGPFECGLWKCFDGFSAGNVAFGAGTIKTAYPEWFGAIGDNSTDDTTAVTVAASSYNKLFLNRTYKMTSSFTTPANLNISGVNGKTTGLYFYGCSGIIMTETSGFGPFIFENFYIQCSGATSGTSYIGLSSTGDTTHQVYTYRFNSLSIMGFNTAASMRTLWNSTFSKCYLLNNYHGIVIRGQSVNTIVEDCQINPNGVTIGAGGAVGIKVEDDGVNRPEDVTVKDCFIYGHATGIYHSTALNGKYINNDIDATTVYGIRYATTDGGLTIRDGWIGMLGANVVAGIMGDALATVNTFPHATISGVTISGDSVAATSYGIFIYQNQKDITISDNVITGFATYDIRLSITGSAKVINNTCNSTIVTSILQDNSLAGALIEFCGNNCVGTIFVHPTSNNGIVVIKQNNAANSTYIQGYAVVLSGQFSTSASFANLPMAPNNFNTATGIFPMPVVHATNWNAGSVWASSTDTAISIFVSSGPSSNTNVFFEIIGKPTFMGYYI